MKYETPELLEVSKATTLILGGDILVPDSEMPPDNLQEPGQLGLD